MNTFSSDYSIEEDSCRMHRLSVSEVKEEANLRECKSTPCLYPEDSHPTVENLKDGAIAVSQKKTNNQFDISSEALTTILLIEDEPFVRKAAARILLYHGYRTLIADSPETAIELAKNYKDQIDLVIANMQLQNINGICLMDEIGTVRSGLKAIFVSGYSMDSLDSASKKAFGDNILTKPFMMDQLIKKVEETLRKP